MSECAVTSPVGERHVSAILEEWDQTGTVLVISKCYLPVVCVTQLPESGGF